MEDIMDKKRLCEHILGLIEAMGMMAENKSREMENLSLAYRDDDFHELIDRLKK